MQVDVLGHAGVWNDRPLQVGIRRQGELGLHEGRPIVRRCDFRGSSPSIHTADGVDLECELVPIGIGFGVGPIRVEGGVAHGGKGAGVDGEDVDETVVLLGQLLGQDTGRRTVAALVGREVFEQHVLGTARQSVEGGGCGLTPVVDGQGDDRVVDDVTASQQQEGGGQ